MCFTYWFFLRCDRQAVAAGTSDGDVSVTWLGDAHVVAAAQRRRKSGQRLCRRVKVELLLRVDMFVGRSACERAALRHSKPCRRNLVRVPCRRREQSRKKRTFRAFDAGRRQRYCRSATTSSQSHHHYHHYFYLLMKYRYTVIWRYMSRTNKAIELLQLPWIQVMNWLQITSMRHGTHK